MAGIDIVPLRDALRGLHGRMDAEARSVFESMVDTSLDAIAADTAAYIDALAIALANRDLGSAKALTERRFPNSRSFAFCFEDDPSTKLVRHLRWTATAPRDHRISINTSYFQLGSHNAAFLCTRMAAVLALVDGYDVGHFGPGAAILDLGDMGAGLGLSFCENRFDSLLIPDCTFLACRGYLHQRELFAAAPPWDDRRPLAIWRGSSTGFTNTGLLDTPRVQLCRIGVGRPDLIEAGISQIVQARSAEDAAALSASGLCKPFVDMTAHAAHKYQIDIDGNTNSWPGLFQKLLSGSPVVKVAPPHGHRQWYYWRLRPWENFVPVRSDMSDLVAVLAFLRGNDALARRIGDAGHELATSMTMESEIASSQSVVRAAFDRDAHLAACRGHDGIV